MVELIKGVKNPLTIIAIFAGLAEISGTGVLPFISESNQTMYIWFLMIFPLVLVGLFFITLNFNSRVLYSPSDFRDEENYMRIFQPASVEQKILKMQDDIAESTEVEKTFDDTKVTSQPNIFTSKAQVSELMTKDPRARYQLAEEIIVGRLSREFRSHPRRDLMLRDNKNGFMFDAVFEHPNGLTVVEVKTLSRTANLQRIHYTIDKIGKAIWNLPDNIRTKTNIILAVAFDMPEDLFNKVKDELVHMISSVDLPIEIRWFDLHDIWKEIDDIK